VLAIAVWWKSIDWGDIFGIFFILLYDIPQQFMKTI